MRASYPVARTTRIARREWSSMAAAKAPGDVGTTNADATVTVALTVPPGTRAIRLAYENVGNAALTVGEFAYCPSTTYNDHLNPTGGAAWTAGSFFYAGARGRLPVDLTTGAAPNVSLPANGGASLEPGLANRWWPASAAVPRFVFSDTMPLNPIQRTDGGRDRIVFIRCRWPQGASVPWHFYDTTGDEGQWKARAASVRLSSGDHVRTPDTISSGTAYGGMPFAFLEAYTTNPGVTILAVGDSQIEGLGSTRDMMAFHARAAWDLTSASCPISVVNAAWQGTRTNQWLVNGLNTIDAVQPQVVIMQGFSGNDDLESSTGADTASLAEGARMQLARILTVRDALPAQVAMIVVTPMPRLYPVLAARATWSAMRAPLLALDSPSIRVLDVTPIAEGVGTPGVWNTSYSADGLHGNDAFHAAVSDQLCKPLLRRMLNLPG